MLSKLSTATNNDTDTYYEVILIYVFTIHDRTEIWEFKLKFLFEHSNNVNWEIAYL